MHQAFGSKDLQHLSGDFRRAGDQQASAGLRIGEQRLLNCAVRREIDQVAVALPVPYRAAGDVPGDRQRTLARTPEPRQTSIRWPRRPKPVTSVSA